MKIFIQGESWFILAKNAFFEFHLHCKLVIENIVGEN